MKKYNYKVLKSIKKYLTLFIVAIVLLVGFYFQILPGLTESISYAGTTYTTLDNTVTPSSTVVNLFDYWITTQDGADDARSITNIYNGINMIDSTNRHRLLFRTSNVGNEGYNNWTGNSNPYQGIVQNKLVNDYPALNSTNTGSDESLAYLFDPSIVHNGKASYQNISNLFYINNDKYYYYNSEENYAYYDDVNKSFKIYDKPAISYSSGSNSTVGSFFPFNSLDRTRAYNGVNDSAINHYFGMTITSRFIQRYDGYTDGKKNVKTTFEFSGDDDVWIFIDNVLVGDIGGIHNRSSIKIDFVTGNIYINDPNMTGNPSTTIRKQFIKAYGEDSNEYKSIKWNGNTFSNDTTHVLNFYYLERGNTASNAYLKFNLTDIPESSVYKIDQYGDKIAGAEFALYSATKEDDGTYKYIADDGNAYTLPANYNLNKNSGVITFDGVTITPKYVDATDNLGQMIFADSLDKPLSMYEIIKLFNSTGIGNTHFILREIKVPDGYRSVALEANFEITDNVIVCDNTYESGVWASNNALVTATNTIYNANTPNSTGINYYNPSTNTTNGTLFAVVLKRDGDNGASPTTSANDITYNWHPVYGNDDIGYNVSSTTGIAAVIEAAKINYANGNRNVFEETTYGMQTLIENLPGKITRYYTYMNDMNISFDVNGTETNSDPQYIVAYFYTTASSLDGATEGNTIRVVSHADADNRVDFGFELLWGTTIEVTNFENRVYFQKMDTDNNLINGATFAMYSVNEDEQSNMYYIGDTGEHIYLNDNNGYNQGTATINENTGTYITNKETGVITVFISDTTYTISPAKNASGTSLVAMTTEDNNYGNDPGSGSFEKVKVGYYVMREINAPTGFLLNTEEVKVLVNDEDIYANAGTLDDGIIVGNGLGYVAPTLNQFATEGSIDETLTWVNFILNYVDKDTSFKTLDAMDDLNLDTYLKSVGTKMEFTTATGGKKESLVSNGTYTKNLSEAMVTYMIFDNKGTNSRFDYKADTNQNARYKDGVLYKEAGQGTERLFTDVGWSSISVYQSGIYGETATKSYTYYEDLSGLKNIGNLFSRSTLIKFIDESIIDLNVKKVVSGNDAITLAGAKFALYKLDDNNNKLYYNYNNTDESLTWVLMNEDNKNNLILETDNNGLTLFKDLTDGEYYLEEVEAPEGYIKLDNNIKITISASKILIDDISIEKKVTVDVDNKTITVPNNTGFILPDTGGKGNKTLIIIGISLISIVISYKIFLKRSEEMKKIFKLLLTITLCFTMLMGVKAEEEKGTITIDNAVKGEKYSIYKILELESYDKTNGYYSYRVATGFANFVNSAAVKDVYLSTNANGYVTWVGGTDAADYKAFADLAKVYIKDNGIAAIDTKTADSSTVTFEDLNLGYYLVSTTLGTIVSLNTTNNEVIIKEKNSVPTVEKTTDSASTHIGDVIEYTVKIGVGKGATNYVLHDTMSAGLTFNGTVSVKLNGTTEVANTNYTLKTTGLTDGCTFEVIFDNAYINTLSDTDNLVITYRATVNANAVTVNTVDNTAKLSYGENSETSTTSTTNTHLWTLNFFKYQGNNIALAGAEFKLCIDERGTNCLTLVNLGNNTYRLAVDGDTTTTDTITTDSTGLFTIKGLDATTYYLFETAAPAGYNKLASPIKIVISTTTDENGVVTMTFTVNGGAVTANGTTINIENKSGLLLPITGGMGTTIIYIMGLVLMVGSVITLIVKRNNN